MSTIKIECPSCQQHIELDAGDSKARDLELEKAREAESDAATMQFFGWAFLVLGGFIAFCVGISNNGGGYSSFALSMTIFSFGIVLAIIFRIMARLAMIHAAILRKRH